MVRRWALDAVRIARIGATQEGPVRGGVSCHQALHARCTVSPPSVRVRVAPSRGRFGPCPRTRRKDPQGTPARTIARPANTRPAARIGPPGARVPARKPRPPAICTGNTGNTGTTAWILGLRVPSLFPVLEKGGTTRSISVQERAAVPSPWCLVQRFQANAARRLPRSPPPHAARLVALLACRSAAYTSSSNKAGVMR